MRPLQGINIDFFLFTRVPLKHTLELLKEKCTEAYTLQLFEHILTATYFLYDGNFTNRRTMWQWVAMALPPVKIIFYMEYLEQKALKTVCPST